MLLKWAEGSITRARRALKDKYPASEKVDQQRFNQFKEYKAQAPPVYQTRQQIASVAARSVFGNNNEKCIDGEVIGYESTAEQLG